MAKKEYTPEQMEKFSKTGRKSRRKGKSFERMVAGVLRLWTPGTDWQTTRNSGRTDIPGDVYAPDRAIKCVIECKHRKNWSVQDIIRNNKGYADEMQKVLIEDWEPVIQTHHYLFIFCFNDAGLWVSVQKVSPGVLNFPGQNVELPDGEIRTKANLSGPDGVLWHLLDQDEQGASRGIQSILFAKA